VSVILVLIVVSLSVAAGFLVAFLWAVRNGQFEDTYGPSVRILMEENNRASSKTPSTPSTEI
jgi:cbb3-type cytochrome oxidase maturation protein